MPDCVRFTGVENVADGFTFDNFFLRYEPDKVWHEVVDYHGTLTMFRERQLATSPDPDDMLPDRFRQELKDAQDRAARLDRDLTAAEEDLSAAMKEKNDIIRGADQELDRLKTHHNSATDDLMRAHALATDKLRAQHLQYKTQQDGIVVRMLEEAVQRDARIRQLEAMVPNIAPTGGPASAGKKSPKAGPSKSP